MLALTRRIGEEVVIGDPAKPIGVIRVVAVHGDKVRLSFDFPRDVKINRKELADLKAKGIPPAGPGGPGGSGGHGPGIPGNGSGEGEGGEQH